MDTEHRTKINHVLFGSFVFQSLTVLITPKLVSAPTTDFHLVLLFYLIFGKHNTHVLCLAVSRLPSQVAEYAI